MVTCYLSLSRALRRLHLLRRILIGLRDCLCSIFDWQESLLWLRFYDTQLKYVLLRPSILHTAKIIDLNFDLFNS